MNNQNDDVDALLKARADIDEQLRLHKNSMTVLFTDVVGSTSFFERNGDTAGLAMIHRHDELTSKIVVKNGGRVVKTIGDSVMAEFPDPNSAVQAAIGIERQFLQLNSTVQANRRVEVRIGIHTGVGFRRGGDLFGDVVNVAARITKRTGPAQILVSRAVQEGISKDTDANFQWLSALTLDGRLEKEDIFEVVWTETEAYRDIRKRLSVPSGIPARYEVLSELGTGGTGIVYKVKDLETGELIALKMLKPELASDPGIQESFKSELRLARKITHKNVCRIYEFSRSEGRAFTSMELVEGESLLSRIQRVGALSVADTVAIVKQICDGLREAHSQGIVHRDLKPANIMIDRSGTVKIMDFGIARLMQGNGHMTAAIVGTPAYMAPEQAELKAVSAATDIYALGLVLYEMITGIPAFDGDTPIAVALKQIREVPKRPREIISGLPLPIEAVILRCLQKEPANRYQSVTELETALRQAMAPKRVATVRHPVLPELRRIGASTQRFVRGVAIQTETFLKRQKWRSTTTYKTQPATLLGVILLVAGVGAAVHGHWKFHSGGSTVAAAGRENVLPTTTSPSPKTQDYAGDPSLPITSAQVDLNGPSTLTNEITALEKEGDTRPTVQKSRPLPISRIKTPATPKGSAPVPVARRSMLPVTVEQTAATLISAPAEVTEPVIQPAAAVSSTVPSPEESFVSVPIDTKDSKNALRSVLSLTPKTWGRLKRNSWRADIKFDRSIKFRGS